MALPTGMLAGEKALVIVGGTTTVNEALLEVVPGLLSTEVIMPLMLSNLPWTVPLTSTETVQAEALAKATFRITKLVSPAAIGAENSAIAPHSVANL